MPPFQHQPTSRTGGAPVPKSEAVAKAAGVPALLDLPALEGNQKASEVVQLYLQGVMKKSIKMAELKGKIESIPNEQKLPVHAASLHWNHMWDTFFICADQFIDFWFW